MLIDRLKQWWKNFAQPWLLSPFFSGLLVVLISWGLYFAYLWPQMLYYDESGLQAGWIGVWGDWAAHIIYAGVFAFRPPSMWFAPHPLHFDSPFTYPFLADAISGWLMRLGMDVVPAFVYPSIITSLFFLAVIYGFYFVFFRKPSTSYVALTIFLLNGGLGFWWFLQDLWKKPNLATLAYPPQEYTHLKEQPIEWISIITSEMIPQRSFLLGFPLVVLVVLVLYSWYQKQFEAVDRWKIVVLGAVSGLFLFVHAHSFLVLFGVAAALLLASWRQWRSWLLYAASTGLVALPIFIWLHADHAGSFVSWLPGWLAHPREKDVNVMYFWWLNYGIFLPLAAWATIRYRWFRHPLILLAWILFLLLNLVQFQPWPWDNTKILTWVHLFLVIPVTLFLSRLWKQAWTGKVLAVCLFVLLTFSSWLDAWRFTRVDKNSYQMWSYHDLAIARAFNEIAEPGDRVLTGQNHNSWVVAHTEGQTLLGFPGWLWTYGVTDPQLSQDIGIMFRGGPEAVQLLEKYEVKFVVIGSPERIDMRANESFFAQRYPLVLQNGEYNVYQVR